MNFFLIVKSGTVIQTMDNGKLLNVFSLNTKGLAGNAKRRCVFNWLKSFRKGIICLQETHSVKENELTWQKEWCGSIYFSHGTSRSRDV